MRKTVLLVDDSKTVREIIKVYLMGQDIEFVEAENGVRALQVARLKLIDLIFADVNMPEMDGITLVQQLRASAQGTVSRIPVVMLTGEKDETLLDRAKDAGANAFVNKPVAAKPILELFQRFALGLAT